MNAEKKMGTIQNLIRNFIEKHTTAWMHLPNNVRDLMIEQPENFSFNVSNQLNDLVPNICYKNVTFKYVYKISNWTLESID